MTATETLSLNDYAEGIPKPDLDRLLVLARNFTRAFREHEGAHVAVREARCLATQYPFILTSCRDAYQLAGWQWAYTFLVGFNLELYANSNIGVVVRDEIPDRALTDEDRELRSKLSACSCAFYYDWGILMELADRLPDGAAEAEELRELARFWETRSTMWHYHQEVGEDITRHLGRVDSMDLRYANSFGSRVCCYSLDIDTLLRLGLPGLRTRIGDRRAAAAGDADAAGTYAGMLLTLDVVESVLAFYAADARAQLALATDAADRARLSRIAESCEHLTAHRPETMHQALQLWWIYQIMADIPNYGRMDQWLGDFYCADIDAGRITDDEAFDLMCNVYQMITDRRYDDPQSHAMPNSRIILGGRGRRNPHEADRFAKLCLKVTRRMHVTEPQTTLRIHGGQAPALFDLALDAIAAGGVYPIIYNDDVHIPWVARAYDVSETEAEQYLPEGCGELQIDHASVGSPNDIINYLSGLDLVLHDGFDTAMGEHRGLRLGGPDDHGSLEAIVDAWKQQVDFTQKVLAKRHAAELRALRKSAAFNLLSILSDDCIERGRALFNGGARYAGGIIESFGLTNTADSLWAIKELVFERRELTLRELVAAIDANFEGHERLRKRLRDLPKFGNDHAGVDALHRELSDFACESAWRAGQEAGLHYFLICNLNPGGGYYRGRTKASADGRRDGDFMALGNNPTAGNDHAGLTSLLNSFAKNDHLHAGYVHNVKMAKSLFGPEHRNRTKALLEAYFADNGCQLMITVIDQVDLEAARREPAKHRDLIVRVAGWNARFVDLGPQEQEDILRRTCYR